MCAGAWATARAYVCLCIDVYGDMCMYKYEYKCKIMHMFVCSRGIMSMCVCVRERVRARFSEHVRLLYRAARAPGFCLFAVRWKSSLEISRFQFPYKCFHETFVAKNNFSHATPCDTSMELLHLFAQRLHSFVNSSALCREVLYASHHL